MHFSFIASFRRKTLICCAKITWLGTWQSRPVHYGPSVFRQHSEDCLKESPDPSWKPIALLGGNHFAALREILQSFPLNREVHYGFRTASLALLTKWASLRGHCYASEFSWLSAKCLGLSHQWDWDHKRALWEPPNACWSQYEWKLGYEVSWKIWRDDPDVSKEHGNFRIWRNINKW